MQPTYQLSLFQNKQKGTMVNKARMGAILHETPSARKVGRARSEELNVLKDKYDSFLKKMSTLLQSLQEQKELMILLENSKSNVAENFIELAKKSPISACAGSYSYVHETVLEKAKFKVGNFERFAVDYVMDWQAVVKKRVTADAKETEKKRIRTRHYQKKVNYLQQTVDKTLAKDKPVPQSMQDKLIRNVGKLDEAKKKYNEAASDLCSLIEECTDRGWRDLYPLLLKCAEFDMYNARDEARLLENLKSVVTDLKTIGSTSGLSYKPRLAEISCSKAENISTKERFYFDEDDTEMESEEEYARALASYCEEGSHNYGCTNKPNVNKDYETPSLESSISYAEEEDKGSSVGYQSEGESYYTTVEKALLLPSYFDEEVAEGEKPLGEDNIEKEFEGYIDIHENTSQKANSTTAPSCYEDEDDHESNLSLGSASLMTTEKDKDVVEKDCQPEQGQEMTRYSPPCEGK